MSTIKDWNEHRQSENENDECGCIDGFPVPCTCGDGLVHAGMGPLHLLIACNRGCVVEEAKNRDVREALDKLKLGGKIPRSDHFIPMASNDPVAK